MMLEALNLRAEWSDTKELVQVRGLHARLCGEFFQRGNDQLLNRLFA